MEIWWGYLMEYDMVCHTYTVYSIHTVYDNYSIYDLGLSENGLLISINSVIMAISNMGTK